jgi:hypothetical protein
MQSARMPSDIATRDGAVLRRAAGPSFAARPGPLVGARPGRLPARRAPWPYHRPTMIEPVRVSLEVVPRRTFAVAVEWPGWTRAGRDEDDALGALLRAGPRYARVVAAAGMELHPPADRSGLLVLARIPGTSTTEFGAPGVPLPGDDALLDEAGLARQAVILQAAWAAFDTAAEQHANAELAKGPRGGGRDLAKIVAHVEDADRAYLVQLGARPPRTATGPAPIADIHAAALAALRARALGLTVTDPSRVTKPWPPRYYVRRAAWHWLDHAWEIEDRAIPAGD